MNYKIKTGAGDQFSKVAEKAKQMATEKNLTVEFDFNGVTCIVDKDTNIDLLYRDYSNSWTMEWKTVGANCLPEYPAEMQAEFEKRTKIAEEKVELENIEYRAKEKREKDAFEAKVKGVEIELEHPDKWKIAVENNSDPYGKAAMDYAEGWAKLMQVEMANGKTLIECAEKTSFEMGFMGITGFMYGCAVQMLAQCWKHGETLRKWHNKEYKHEGEGVVNPAILTIG